MWHEDGSLAVAIQRIERDVEALCGVPVEAVTVGDCELDEDLAALVDAGAGGDDQRRQVVRGVGDLALRRGRAADGLGVRARPRQGLRSRPRSRPTGKGLSESIHGRMARHGGTSTVRSTPGDGNRGRARHAPRPQAAGGRSAIVTPRVFLVDDHAALPGRACAPSSATAVDVVGEADDVAPAVELIGERLPDVVLLDVHLPSGGGQAVVEAVQARPPGGALPRAVGVRRPRGRDRRDPRRRPRLRHQDDLGTRARRRGERVAGGDAVFSPRLAGFVLDAFSLDAGRALAGRFDPELDQLTAREREVLRLIARGYTYKEIARELSISAKTVESHVSSVLRKLQLSTRHQLTRWAAERRLA